jgi:YegS/Rv2252/BmrU family lipid kinase
MYHVIVNPAARSGRGKKNWEIVKRVLDEKEVKYKSYLTSKHGDAARIVSKICEENERVHLMVLGGDGTLNEVIQGLDSFENVALSTIPVGSSNDLARALRISSDPVEAVTHLLTKPTILYMDMGTVHCENSLVREGNMSIPDRHFLVSCGMGYDASVCHEALSSGIKNFFNRLGLGKLSYLFICIKQLIFSRFVTAELTLEGSSDVISLEKLIFLGGMNNRYEGGGFMFAPDASNHDGMIDLLAVHGISKPGIIKLLPTALEGEHLGNEGVDLYRTCGYSVRTSSPLWVHTDGEVETKADYISVSCKKEAIKIIY